MTLKPAITKKLLRETCISIAYLYCCELMILGITSCQQIVSSAILTFSVSVFLNIPNGIELIVLFVADDFVLIESPFWINLSGKLQSLTRIDVDQLDLRSNRLPVTNRLIQTLNS